MFWRSASFFFFGFFLNLKKKKKTVNLHKNRKIKVITHKFVSIHTPLIIFWMRCGFYPYDTIPLKSIYSPWNILSNWPINWCKSQLIYSCVDQLQLFNFQLSTRCLLLRKMSLTAIQIQHINCYYPIEFHYVRIMELINVYIVMRLME